MAKEDRGFASMDKEKQREIASKGGTEAHRRGTAHECDSEGAKNASLISAERRRERKALATGVIND